MCGIAGICYWDRNRSVSDEIINKMISKIIHRGPDDYGIYIKDNIGFGHRRLSIIDLSTGHQPMNNDDNSIVLIFNGEIYNFKELRQNLIKCGKTFKTNSDTEVIIKGYEVYGREFVSYLRGMFAFALWDSNKHVLLIARDRLGKKPLYYFSNKSGFAFASEIKSLFESKLINPEINKDAIDSFFSLGYVLAPETIFQNIKKLEPGHILIIKDGKIKNLRYWDLAGRKKNNELNYVECENEFMRLLRESVKLRMISDVPFGAFLSGGIDSSTIVGLMTEFSDVPIKTFTVGYKGYPDQSELKYADIVARHFETEHHEFILEPVDFYEAITKMIHHCEEPIGDQACIPLWLLACKAKDYVTVMLSGEGSDELLGGYKIYWLMKQLSYYKKIPDKLKIKFFLPLLKKILGNRRAKKYHYWGCLPLRQRFLGDMADLVDPFKDGLYSHDLRLRSIQNPVEAILSPYYDEVINLDDYSKMMFLDIKTWLVEDLLLKADKMTMACSLELRAPFLDHELVEFTQSIPSKFKIKGLKTKYIIKRATKKLLPKKIINRKKEGFPVPLAAWFKKQLSEQVISLLNEKKTSERGYFNQNYIQTILKRHYCGRDDYSKLVWNLVVFEIWHRCFIDNQSY